MSNNITLVQAAQTLPKINGKKPCAVTVWRWARKGVRGVKLETEQIGGRLVTTAEAVERFLAKVSAS